MISYQSDQRRLSGYVLSNGLRACLTREQTTFVLLSNLPTSQQSAVDEIMLGIGPNLAEVLINNIGGNAARSELDSLSEPLKKLVFKQPMSKKWLGAALLKPSFPSQQIDTREKNVFLGKVMA